MKILLADINPELGNAWSPLAEQYPDHVSLHHGNILDLPCDAVVSPANSLGFMNGGIDAIYREFFGYEIQDRVQDHIRDHFGGSIPVGEAFVIPTNAALRPQINQIGSLVVAPTMTLPMRLELDTEAPYLATKAALRVFTGDVIAFPGLGTGAGGVSPAQCAKQMHRAISEVLA